jgi:hypothetical protein
VALLAGLCLAAPAQAGMFDEVRLGGFQHDTGLVGTHREPGADVGGELIFTSPDILKPLHAPRPLLGMLVNTAGRTSQVYAGFTDHITLGRDLLRDGDAVYLEGTLAAGVNDGKGDVRGTPLASSWKSHGIAFDFHPALGIGYRIDPHWSLELAFSHTSNAGLGRYNDGMNDLGLWLGRHF